VRCEVCLCSRINLLVAITDNPVISLQSTSSYIESCNTFKWSISTELSYEGFLTGPDETDYIICCNRNALGEEAIFHGGIGLHNVSSLSHSHDVVNVGLLVFFRKKVS